MSFLTTLKNLIWKGGAKLGMTKSLTKITDDTVTYEKDGIIYVPMKNEADYDYYFDVVGDYIADSLNEAGELNENGLRLESAWDYADWSED